MSGKSNKNNKKEKKKGGGALFLILILLLAILLLFLWKGGFGLGGGNGAGIGGQGNSAETSVETGEALQGITGTEKESETETTVPDETENGASFDENTIKVTVSGDKISANGKDFENADKLKEFILGTDYKNKTVILSDSKALKSSYDEAKSVLDGLGIEYSEETE